MGFKKSILGKVLIAFIFVIVCTNNAWAYNNFVDKATKANNFKYVTANSYKNESENILLLSSSNPSYEHEGFYGEDLKDVERIREEFMEEAKNDNGETLFSVFFIILAIAIVYFILNKISKRKKCRG